MFDLKRTVFCFLVVYIVNTAAENAATADLDLSRVFRTPKDKDFSRVNFDHFEILERNNFDPTPAAAQQAASDAPKTEAASEAAQHHPKSVANAQVMLRFGGDDIHGKNCIETPERPAPYHPCPHPHHNHHLQSNDIRYPYPPYGPPPQQSPYLPIPPPPYGYPYPPYAFPGMYYPTAEFGGPYRVDQGHLVPGDDDSCSCSEESKAFLGKSDVCENANTDHLEIIPPIDLTEEAIPECQKCNGSPVKPPTEKIPHQYPPQSDKGPVPFPGFKDDVKKSEDVDNRNDRGPVPFPGVRDNVEESEDSSDSCSSAENSPDIVNKEHAKEGKWPEIIYVKPPKIDHPHHHHDDTLKETVIKAKIEHAKEEISDKIDHVKDLKEELHHLQHHTTCAPVDHHHPHEEIKPKHPPVIVKSEHIKEEIQHKIDHIKHIKDELHHHQHHTTYPPVQHHHPDVVYVQPPKNDYPHHHHDDTLKETVIKAKIEHTKEEISDKIDHVKDLKEELHHLQHHTTCAPVHHHHPHEDIKHPPIIIKTEHAKKDILHKIDHIQHMKDDLHHHQHHTTGPQVQHHNPHVVYVQPLKIDHPYHHHDDTLKETVIKAKIEHTKEEISDKIDHVKDLKEELHHLQHQTTCAPVHHHHPHEDIKPEHPPIIVKIEHAKEDILHKIDHIKHIKDDLHHHEHHTTCSPVVSDYPIPQHHHHHHHPILHGESPKHFPGAEKCEHSKEQKWLDIKPVEFPKNDHHDHHHHPKHFPEIVKIEHHSKEQKWPKINHVEPPRNENHDHHHHHEPNPKHILDIIKKEHAKEHLQHELYKPGPLVIIPPHEPHHPHPHVETIPKPFPEIVKIEHAKEKTWPEVTYIKPPHIDHHPHKIIPVVSSPPNYPYHPHKHYPEIVEKEKAEEKKWPEGTYHHHQHPQVIFIDKVHPIAHPKETPYLDILSGEDDCKKCRTHPGELEAWLNKSIVPYDCQVCGHRPKLLVTYPVTCNGAPNEYDEDIRISGCQCCRKHGFCDCRNCNCQRNPNIPFGKRFPSDLDSLHRVVRPAVPEVQVYCDERRPRHYSAGYTSGSGSSICASVSQVGSQPPETHINGYRTSEGSGHYSDPSKDIYYQEPKVVQVIRTPNPCLPVVEHTRFERPSCYSVVPKKVTPACVPDLVPTDVFVCKQCGGPHHRRMVCHREYVPRGVIEGEPRSYLGHGEPCQGVFRLPVAREDVVPVRADVRDVPIVPVRDVPIVPVREFVAVGPQTYEVCRRFPRQTNVTEIAADK